MFYAFSLETSLLLFAESVVGGLSTRTLAELLGSSSGPASVGGEPGTRREAARSAAELLVYIYIYIYMSVSCCLTVPPPPPWYGP